MAGRGPAPKDPEQLRRRNGDASFEELPAEGFTGRFPPLPKTWRHEVITTKKNKKGEAETVVKTVRVTFLAETRRWYEEWARSPMAVRFTQVDWRRLRNIAPLHDQYERHPTTKLAAELRLQESLLGATVADRQRMRVRVAEASAEGRGRGGARVADLAAERRARLVAAPKPVG